MSAHRLPDGSTVFLCGRGASETREDRLKKWVRAEATKQGRCVWCMGKIGVECPAERSDRCVRKHASLADALVILRGMVAG